MAQLNFKHRSWILKRIVESPDLETELEQHVWTVKFNLKKKTQEKNTRYRDT